MTGFGCADFTSGKTKGLIEIKSVNHRYLDIAYFLPTGFAVVESKIRDILSKQMERGRVTVFIKITSKPPQAISLNKEAVQTYLRQEKALEKEFGLKGELSLSELMQLPGVIDARETTLGAEELWPSIEKGFFIALKSLLFMRQREGKSLAREISDFLKRMSSRMAEIRARAKVILKEKKKKLSSEEFSSIQKSSDVNEELTRLSHHIEEMKPLLSSSTAVGKKIDFIAQEMQREVNTIGSKLQDKIVSGAVIMLKSKIEKIREQSQNIE